MKILVTGSTGFIGRHVVEWLVNNGYPVHEGMAFWGDNTRLQEVIIDA